MNIEQTVTSGLFRKSVYAGILIGVGDIISLSLSNKYIAAMLFSIGLLTIIHEGLNLYTGKIGLLNESLEDYFLIFFGNFVGVCTTTMIGIIVSSRWLEMINRAVEISHRKFVCAPIELFFKGALCGVCMYVAVSCKNQLITVFAIMTFILCGFEHCIADIPYYLISLSPHSTLKFIMIIAGNSFGAILIDKLKNA